MAIYDTQGNPVTIVAAELKLNRNVSKGWHSVLSITIQYPDEDTPCVVGQPELYADGGLPEILETVYAVNPALRDERQS